MKWLLLAFALATAPLRADDAPDWFAQSLLHLPDDVAEAARAGKRVMLYFGQPGCPYCKQLMEVNFRQRPIAERMQKEFVALELSIWGDRDITWTDGRETTEKKLAGLLKVQYTPTLVFLDEKGAIAHRVNGYYPPARFMAALDQAWGKPPTPLASAGKAEMSAERFFLVTTDLRRKKPLAVLFETAYCAECDELHASALRDPAVRAELARYDVVRLPLSGSDVITTPGGREMKAADWARSLKVDYVPTLVLFDDKRTERLRMEAYFRAFHVAGSLAYVSSGAWRREPSFQRFLQARADELKRRGKPVDLWD
ncbi:MAG TPA: thioredoxin fold domain-containing protein [Burkholderiales bacterium]|nr:thioredoxin fold domain-containing protein [Burkholderiales bacterium]